MAGINGGGDGHHGDGGHGDGDGTGNGDDGVGGDSGRKFVVDAALSEAARANDDVARIVADIWSALAPHFQGTLRALDIPRSDDEPAQAHPLEDDEILALGWQFEGEHTAPGGGCFRGIKAETSPRSVNFVGVHFITKQGEDRQLRRIVDEATLMAQLGVLPSSRQLGQQVSRLD